MDKFREFKEIKIRLKDDEKSVTQKFMVYEDVVISQHDPEILKCIVEARKSFDGIPESTRIQIIMEIV